MKLRDYQIKAVQSIYDHFESGKEAPLVVTPTGSGKSVILAEFIRSACMKHYGTKVLVVTHSKELVLQNFEKIKSLWKDCPVGVYAASAKRREMRQITVASIQSIYKKEHFYGYFDIILVDECHAISKQGMYKTLLIESNKKNPDVKLIGLTATPYRLDNGLLHEGDDALFDGISYEVPLAELILDGYLSPLTSKEADKVDLSGVKMTAGEFNQGQLGERMSAIELVDHHIDIILTKCADRKSVLIFAVTIEHAVLLVESFKLKGASIDYVTGEMDGKDRDERIRKFKSGETWALVNVGVLTTGFDHPATDVICILRPTMSPGLFVQMVGRGFRPVYAQGYDLSTKQGRIDAIANGPKKDCLVLDFGGNFLRHGMIDQIEAPGKKRKGIEGVAPVKVCPKCGEIAAISLKECKCEFVFPINERESENRAHEGAVVSINLPPKVLHPPEWFDVQRVSYLSHTGKSGIQTMRVTYSCGFQSFSEYICLEHDGYARGKAEKWWAARCMTGQAAPRTVHYALTQLIELIEPTRILVDLNGKYPEIKECDFKKIKPTRKFSEEVPF